MALVLQINGELRTLEHLSAPATLDRVVEELGLQSGRVAVEVNGEIAPRSGWQGTPIADHDKIEVVHFVGGGTIEE